MAHYLFAHVRNSILKKLVSGRITFKKDGDEFKREMIAMHDQFHPKSEPFMIQCRKKAYWARRKEFLQTLREMESPITIAIFCHGSKHWIYGIGYNRNNIQLLAQHIKENTASKVHIVLYACSCGKGTGAKYPIAGVPKKAGVAMMLANHLAMLGVNFKIVAHDTRGHTTINPRCVFIEKATSTSKLDTGYIVKTTVVERVTRYQVIMKKKSKGARKLWLLWCRELRNNPKFRFRFPYMSQDEIHTHLKAINV